MICIINPERFRVAVKRSPISSGRIGHVNLRVTDLDRATDFYRDVLGLTIAYYGPAIRVPAVFLAFGDYHHHVALNWFYSDGEKANPVRHDGLNHSQSSMRMSRYWRARWLGFSTMTSRSTKHATTASRCRYTFTIPMAMGLSSTTTDRKLSGSMEPAKW